MTGILGPICFCGWNCFCGWKVFLQKIKFVFCFKLIIFFMFLDRFYVLISKINFKKIKKHYFNAFPSEKHFEKQLLPRYQTGSWKDTALILGSRVIDVFTFWTVDFDSTRTRNVWLTNWKAGLSTAINSWASPKVIVFVLLQLLKFPKQHLMPN